MKSRRARRSATRETPVAAAFVTETKRGFPDAAGPRIVDAKTKPADRRVPATARAPSPSGQASPVSRLQPTEIAAKIATWTTLSLQ